MFLLRSIDQALPQLRGAQIFRTLFNHKTNGLIVNKTITAPGHFAVLLHGQTSMCVFDLVPTSSLHISSSVQEALTQAILRRSPAENPAVLVHHSSAPIVSVSFEGDKLLAIYSDGSLASWLWHSKDLQWKPHARAQIQLPTGGAPKLVSAVHFPHLKSIICWENTSGAFGRLLQCTGVDLNSAISASTTSGGSVTSAFGASAQSNQLKLNRAEILSFERDDVSEIVSSRSSSVWLLSGLQGLPSHLFSSRTARLTTIKYPEGAGVTLSTVFPSTGEMLFLGRDGQVLVCPPEDPNHQSAPPGNATSSSALSPLSLFSVLSATPSSSTSVSDVTPKALCSLQGLSSTADVIDFFAHRNVLGLVRASSISLYDLKTGIALATEPLPFRFEKPTASSTTGRTSGICERWNSLSDVWLWSGTNGFYQLHMPAVLQLASKMHNSTIAALANGTGSSSSTTSAAAVVHPSAGLCADWSLDHRSAKYLLDQAIDSRHYTLEARKAATVELLPHLPNPALVLGLSMNLESSSPSPSATSSKSPDPSSQHQLCASQVHAEVGQFLERFSGGDGSAAGHEAAAAAERAFGAYTPLNVSLLPLLSKYQQLVAQRHLNQLSTNHHLQGLSPLVIRTQDVSASSLDSIRDLRTISRSEMESLIRNCGARLLSRLEQMFQLDSSSPRSNSAALVVPESSTGITASSSSSSLRTFPIVANELLHEEEALDEMVSGERSPQHPYFEILCKLYYEHNPAELCRFVRSIEKAYVTATAASGSANVRRSSRTHYERALLAIPPNNNETAPGADDAQHQHEQLRARADLLSCCGHVCDAAHLLLRENMWTDALSLLRDRSDQDVPHFEMFQALLAHSLAGGQDDRTQRVLELAPNALNALNILRLVRIALPQQQQPPAILAQSATELSISALIPKLQLMCARQPVDLL